MGKTIIGTRGRVVIGDKPPKEDDPETIIGYDSTVYIPTKELHKYDKIVGIDASITIGTPDDPIQKIIKTMEGLDDPKKEKILKLCNELKKDQSKDKAKELISITSGIVSLANSVLELKSKFGL